MDSVLVTGSTGLLGTRLVPILREHGHKIVTQARLEKADFNIDLSDRDSVFEMLDSVQPSVIVNLVGLTSVELCQEQTNMAYLVNTRSVENIASWISGKDRLSHLIQISTDHVYDGLGPHTEEVVTLTNNYAFSKYCGELAAALVPSSIVRTNFIGRSKAPDRDSLTDWIFTSLRGNKDIQVLDDVFFSPLSMTTLSEMLSLVVAEKPIGTFNLGSNCGMSKADFDFAFADTLGLQTETMKRAHVDNVSFLKAHRPKDMRMDCSRFENTFELKLPSLNDEILRAAGDYRG